MTIGVFLAVIFAAVLHASWNALLKHGSDKYLGMTGVMVGHLPLAILAALYAPLPDPQSYPFILASVFLHFGYQVFLLTSYRFGDLTQVYPIARGTAPLIVTGVSITILNVTLLPMELAGVLIIAAGLISLSLVRQDSGSRNSKAALLAAVTGCFIAGYSLNDGLGARAAETSLGFYAWSTIGNAFIYSFVIRLWKPGTLTKMVTTDTGRRIAVIGGSASFVAYAIVTWAFTQAPIALVTALRETSIVFALLIGVFAMRERLDLPKLVATFCTLVGAALIRLAR